MNQISEKKFINKEMGGSATFLQNKYIYAEY